MVNYYSSNGDIEHFSNSYPADYLTNSDQLPSEGGDDNLFESNPITIPFHDNFTLVGHMDFDGNLNTIDILEKVSIKKPNPDSYKEFKDIIGECEQEVDIIFQEASISENKIALHFRFLLHKLDNQQPFYFCYYLDEKGTQYPMNWITFALRNMSSGLKKHVYLYTFQLNNMYSEFSDFISAYNTSMKLQSYSYFKKLLSEDKIVYKWYVMKFGSSYSDDYINTMSRNDYILDINHSFINGEIKDFTLMGHNDFDNNIVTKDNILITPEDDGLKIGVTPTIQNYGQSITLKLSKLDHIWRYGDIVHIENYGFYPVTVTHKINGKLNNDFVGNDFFFANIKQSKDKSNYMIIIYRLEESVYQPIINKMTSEADSDYYIHYPADDISKRENKNITYKEILTRYPFPWETEANIFNWLIIKADSNIVKSTKVSTIDNQNIDITTERTNNSSKTDESTNPIIYILGFLILLVLIYIVYSKSLKKSTN